MRNNRFLKNTVAAGMALSLMATSNPGVVLASQNAQEDNMAGMSYILDNFLDTSAIERVISGTSISISGGAIFAETTTGSAISVSQGAITVDQTLAESTQKKDKTEKKVRYKNTAISIADSYVCIRKKASKSSKILGKLYRGSSATILSTKGKWTKVKSGSVTGYVAKEYLTSGNAVVKYEKKYGTKVAQVTTETLRVRDRKSTKSDIVKLVSVDDTMKVVSVSDDWVKVKVGDDTGYVSKDYVDVKVKFDKAVSIKEEQAAQSSSTSSSITSYSSSNRSTSGTSSYQGRVLGSGSGASIAKYAVSFVGNPYVWGGTSLTSGADCSGFTQAVMRNFGISIPRTSREQCGVGQKVSASQAKAGDLVFYTSGGRVNHVALCIGGGRVVHASNPSTGIRISNMYYRSPYAVRRVVG